MLFVCPSQVNSLSDLVPCSEHDAPVISRPIDRSLSNNARCYNHKKTLPAAGFSTVESSESLSGVLEYIMDVMARPIGVQRPILIKNSVTVKIFYSKCNDIIAIYVNIYANSEFLGEEQHDRRYIY